MEAGERDKTAMIEKFIGIGYPNLRRYVLDYDLRVSGGRVELNAVSESMSADR